MVEVAQVVRGGSASPAEGPELERALAWFGRIGKALSAARDVDEVAALACVLVAEEGGYAGVRVSVVPAEDDEPLPRACRGDRSGAPLAVHELARGGRRLGRIETWGSPRHPDLLPALLPWLIPVLDLRRELEHLRERAASAFGQRDALATLVKDRPTWILGEGGSVEWCNEEGHLELAVDAALAGKLRAAPDPDEFEVVEAGSARRVVARHAGESEVDRRATRAAERWSLTLAQEKVLARMARGLSTGEVARDLCVRESTIESHLGQIYRRSRTASRSELLFAFWTM